jgi:hypothetical protein
MDLADDVRQGQRIDPGSYEPRTLRSDLDRLQRLPVNECLRVGLALCSALGYLHRRGVVHRDVKPSNIIFIHHEPRFADIGLVDDIGEPKAFLGSGDYTPPEGSGKPTADLYGLGKVLFEIVTGRDHREFPELPAGFDQWPDMTARRRLFEVTVKACERNPRLRYQSGEEMYQALQRVYQEAPTEIMPGGVPAAEVPAGPQRLVVVGDLASGRLSEFAALLERELEQDQIQIFVDRPGETILVRAQQIEAEISRADALVALVTPDSLESEMLSYELQFAQSEAAQHGGRPCVIPILIGLDAAQQPLLAELFGSARVHRWDPAADPAEGVRQVRTILSRWNSYLQSEPRLKLETVGGAVPLDSPFYLSRPTDQVLHAAIAAGESTVLIKGARQMGKTSLLARGLQRARERGQRVAHTDLQQLNAAGFESLENLYFALGNSLADALDLDVLPEDTWDSRRTPNLNLERYLRREVLGKVTSHLVWGIDEVDRLLPCPFGVEAFSLMRSWHNARALDPTTPWSRLSLVIAFATEAHLFITDLNQSPFNVGTRVPLDDFTPDQVAELNRLYGNPLASDRDRQQFIELVGGQPYLVRRALHEMITRTLDFEAFRREAEKDDGIFTDHLRRLVMLLAKDAALADAVRRVVRGAPCPSQDAFLRLRAGGVFAGGTMQETRFRCGLYQRHLQRALA